ncbi:MAG TPA: DUF1176 domain-containing protein [Lysobacter sp.]|nr:DUF1176 domain-containing protein [Lysobacter sp.]
MSRSALLALLLAAPLAHAAPSLPAYREFDDWLVACDNTGHCEARGLQDRADALALVLRRDAAAGAVPVLELRALADPHLPPAFAFDGRAVPIDARDWFVHIEELDGADAYWLRSRGIAAVHKFVDAARRAQRVGIAGEHAHGSLAGLNAALLFIDEVQGRVGTRGALLARGERDDGAVPPPRPPPVLRASPWSGAQPEARDARRYLQRLPSPADCDDDATPADGTLVAISASEAIALVPCLRGAYQTTYALYRGPRAAPERARPLTLVLDPLDGRRQPALLANVAYDPATATLRAHAKGRGLFDCGDRAEWVFDGRTFELADYRRQDRCGGTAPGDFPVLWRTRVLAEPPR